MLHIRERVVTQPRQKQLETLPNDPIYPAAASCAHGARPRCARRRPHSQIDILVIFGDFAGPGRAILRSKSENLMPKSGGQTAEKKVKLS